MIVFGMSETAEDVRLWEESGVRSCVDPTFTNGECSGFISGLVDTGRETSAVVWADAVNLHSPSVVFSPVFYDGGELGSYVEKARATIPVPDSGLIFRAGCNATLGVIGMLELDTIALDCSDWDGGAYHWLLEEVSVWLVMGRSPRQQWQTWLELKYWGVSVAGVVLAPPATYHTHHLDPSNLGTTSSSRRNDQSDDCSRRNSRVMAAFWERIARDSHRTQPSF